MAIFVSTEVHRVKLPEALTGKETLPDREGVFGALAATGDPDGAPGHAGTLPGLPGQPSNMAESVTRHALNPPPRDFKFLLCGIDTLDLGLYVQWDMNWGRIRACLDEKKQQAQGTTGFLDKTDIGREFLHLPSGKPPNYRFHLQYTEYHIYVAISDKPGISPNVYVSINAETLWHVGLSTILELLEFDLGNFGGTIERIQPSRVDLCADFKLSEPLTFSLLEILRVSRTRKIRMIMNGGALETYYSGSADSPVQVRIYDKGKEILKSNKQWFLPLWGLDDPAGVWRVEFQLRRSFLHQYRINTLEGLWDKIGAMWAYLTDEWFSLRLLDNDKAERRSVLPWWQAVQECRDRFGDLADTKRTFTSDSVEPIKKTVAHIIGRLVSIAAQSGIKDRKEAIKHLSEILHKSTDDEKFRSEYLKKSIKLGFRGILGGSDDEC